MADNKRLERMLEEVIKLPGNDCHTSSPRWASVNLGITLCVNCASIHRKLGTHKSRVKSVTLDTWTREQINSLKTQGNTLSNGIYNPNERLHPPPTSVGGDERDSEMEKYIRRKYELGAFKGGVAASGTAAGGAGRTGGSEGPLTSMDRARERKALAGGGIWDKENKRNPELNDLLVRRERKERDLPPLPPSASEVQSQTGTQGGARARPERERKLVDINDSPTTTALPAAHQGYTTPTPGPVGGTSSYPYYAPNPFYPSAQPQPMQYQTQFQQQPQQPQALGNGMGYQPYPNNPFTNPGIGATQYPMMPGGAWQQPQQQQPQQQQQQQYWGANMNGQVPGMYRPGM